MTKRIIILLSFLAYSLTLVHSIVPHHHHDKTASGHHHHNTSDSHHHDDEDETVSHAFADVIHFPGADIVIHPDQARVIQKYSHVAELYVDNVTHLLSPQLKPPDLNIDQGQKCYSSGYHSLFLLRGPPVV
jgi:hypothetical protein